LKLPTKKRTKTGPATDVTVLEELSEEHALPKMILEYRQYQKLQSTYVDALPTMVSPVTGRIHTSFNQTIAATGRLSSTNPNLQNIPIRTDLGKEMRKAFIVEPGNVLLSADYSQIELRIFAHVAEDENMIEAFAKGEDIHAATAAKIYAIPLAEVTGDQRRYAKVINFGLMYGMGSFRLSKELGISVQDAKTFIDTYFASFPRIQETIERIIAQAKQDGYVTTLFGRKRYIPEINNMNRTLQEMGKREAVNSVIQGTAADIIKLAMIAIHAAFREQKLCSKMLLQIHDELLFEVVPGEEELVKKIIQEKMEGVIELTAPLKVEMGWGANWLEAH